MKMTAGIELRSEIIDLCKAWGMILVVWGHSSGIPVTAATLIYSFHMPLFFFISGYLLKTSRLQRSITKEVAELARALLVPYVFFFLVSLVYWLLTRDLGARAEKYAGVTLQDALVGLWTGVSADLFVNAALWFFPCMFVTQILYRTAWRALPRDGFLFVGSLAIACTVLLLTLPWKNRLPWSFDIAWISLAFFSLGRLLRGIPMQSIVMTTKPILVRMPIFALVFMVWLLLALWQGRVDLAAGNFGRSFMAYFLVAGFGVFLVIAASSVFKTNAVLQWISENTLLIFPLHPLFINLGSGIAKFLGVESYGLGASVLFTCWGLLCSVPAAFLIKRYVPFLIGVKSPTNRRSAHEAI